MICNRQPSPNEEPTRHRMGFVYRERNGAAQLWEYRRRMVRVLTLESGRLRQNLFRRNGSPLHDNHTLDLGELYRRGAEAGRLAERRRLLCLLDPDAVAIQRFTSQIPPATWRRALAYPRWMGFQMLAMFVNVGEPAISLHDGGCHGFVALAASADWLLRRKTSVEWIRDLLKRPQAEALGMLSLPATKRVARIVRKVEPLACHYPLLRNLHVLRDERLACEVSHLPRINDAVLTVLPYCTPPDRLVTPACLREISEQATDDARALSVLVQKYVTRMRPLERILSEGSPLRIFDAVKSLHIVCLACSYENIPRWRRAAQIPSPPCPDEFGFVEWIRTPKELYREGKRMGTRVFGYLPYLTQGRAAVATVTHNGEQATALVKRNHGGTLTLRDMRLSYNREAPEEMIAAFTDWLAKQQVQRGTRDQLC